MMTPCNHVILLARLNQLKSTWRPVCIPQRNASMVEDWGLGTTFVFISWIPSVTETMVLSSWIDQYCRYSDRLLHSVLPCISPKKPFCQPGHSLPYSTIIHIYLYIYRLHSPPFIGRDVPCPRPLYVLDHIYILVSFAVWRTSVQVRIAFSWSCWGRNRRRKMARSRRCRWQI